MDQIPHVGHKCFQVHQLSESPCQPEGAARIRSKPRTISLLSNALCLSASIWWWLLNFSSLRGPFISAWSLKQERFQPICRTLCFLFSQKKSSIQDQNAVTLSSRHFVYFFLWIFLPSDRDGLWSSCHCFCLFGANPHQDVTPGLRKRKQFQRIGDENLATWTRNQWDRKLRSILRIILSWSKSFCPLLIEIRIFTSAFWELCRALLPKSANFDIFLGLMIHVSTLTLLDELGMERREKRKSTKNADKYERCWFHFLEWKDHETSTNECYVFY